MKDEEELTHIDLFSGIGGFTLAAEWAGFKTVVFCEKEKFCQKILKKRFGAIAYTDNGGHTRNLRETVSRGKDKAIPNSKFSCRNSGGSGIFRPLLIPEIRGFDGTKYRGAALLTGGFPCQPFSVAGQRRGKEDDRYLWPEMLRIIKEAKPRWILAENVAGIVKMALGQVLSDLESIGYDFPRDHEGTPIVPVIPACGLNAPHRRNRVWIVAHAIRPGARNQSGEINDQRGQVSQDRREGIRQEDRKISSSGLASTDKNACDTSSNRHQGRPEKTRRTKREGKQGGMRESEGTDSYAPNPKSRMPGQQAEQERGEDFSRGDSENDSNASSQGLSKPQKSSFAKLLLSAQRGDWEKSWYEVATRFCRVDDGLSDRVHRLKALGNAIVPQIAYEILKNIAWIEKEAKCQS